MRPDRVAGVAWVVEVVSVMGFFLMRVVAAAPPGYSIRCDGAEGP
jgi:hypothetical protein